MTLEDIFALIDNADPQVAVTGWSATTNLDLSPSTSVETNELELWTRLCSASSDIRDYQLFRHAGRALAGHLVIASPQWRARRFDILSSFSVRAALDVWSHVMRTLLADFRSAITATRNSSPQETERYAKIRFQRSSFVKTIELDLNLVATLLESISDDATNEGSMPITYVGVPDAYDVLRDLLQILNDAYDDYLYRQRLSATELSFKNAGSDENSDALLNYGQYTEFTRRLLAVSLTLKDSGVSLQSLYRLRATPTLLADPELQARLLGFLGRALERIGIVVKDSSTTEFYAVYQVNLEGASCLKDGLELIFRLLPDSVPALTPGFAALPWNNQNLRALLKALPDPGLWAPGERPPGADLLLALYQPKVKGAGMKNLGKWLGAAGLLERPALPTLPEHLPLTLSELQALTKLLKLPNSAWKPKAGLSMFPPHWPSDVRELLAWCGGSSDWGFEQAVPGLDEQYVKYFEIYITERESDFFEPGTPEYEELRAEEEEEAEPLVWDAQEIAPLFLLPPEQLITLAAGGGNTWVVAPGLRSEAGYAPVLFLNHSTVCAEPTANSLAEHLARILLNLWAEREVAQPQVRALLDTPVTVLEPVH